MNEIKFDIIKHSVIDGGDTPDLSFVPPVIRRRANNHDKAVLYTLNECIDKNVSHIYFSSRYGEFERLVKIIEQYKVENEVSPTVFSSSVHNFPVGLFSILKQNGIPSTAIAAGENSFETGMIIALSAKKPVLYCFTGEENDKIFGGCFYFRPGENFSMTVNPVENHSDLTLSAFKDFVDGRDKRICGKNCVLKRF